MYDVIIRGGQVIDGSGAAGYAGDVAIEGDRIAALGRVEGVARSEIDASGLVVGPGFIDLHSHSDFNFFIDPMADSKIRQGVTVELTGNCGLSFCAPLTDESRVPLDTRVGWYPTDWTPTWTSFGGYLDALEQNGSTLNLATQVGHGTVRHAVLGMATRAPDTGELKRMRSLVEEALEAGALGFSTGLSMTPGNFSLTEEVMELAAAAAERDRLYSTHMRDSSDESSGLFVAIHEAMEIGRRTGVRVQMSHLKCGGSMRGRAEEILETIERGRKEGIDLAADQYPYTAGSGHMSGNTLPRWIQEGGREKALERLADADLRAEARVGIDRAIARAGGPERFMIANFPPDISYEGKDVAALADQLGVEPAETLVLLYERYDAQLILSGMTEPDVRAIAKADFTAVASDGDSLRTEGPLSIGSPHPRSYGTFPRFFAQMARGSDGVTIENAVRKMTALPAERLGLSARGRLAPGYLADVVVFDADSIEDRADFSSPHQYSDGVHHVLVNGVAVVAGGVSTGATPGRVLRDEAH